MALLQWIRAPFSQGTPVPTTAPTTGDSTPSIPMRDDSFVARGGSRAGVAYVGTTPAMRMRSMIDKGQGPAHGMSARTRLEALEGMRLMGERNPHVVAAMAEEPTNSDVCDLITYARQHASA